MGTRSRRWLLLPAALLAAASVCACVAALPSPPLIQGFSLADVELPRNSQFAANFEQNTAYLLQLAPDNLLFNFRTTAGLPAPGQSYGGWESPDSEVRGQFIGHYLSATAFALQHTGRAELRDRCALMVSELGKVQDALGSGYLAAFPPSHFDRLEALQPVWAPYYVVHKLLAGLLEQAQLAGQADALRMARGMADYFCARVRHVLDANGTAYWHQVLETEFGGMNEVLYRLYGVTEEKQYAECAHWFDKPAFYRPLVEGQDPLPGLHANTHLAQVQGFAARFEHLGDSEGLAATANFFGLLLQHHTFSTGGSNWYEHWGEEDSLGEPLTDTGASATTEESCTQYNVLKLARFLFRHTGDAALSDFYERALLNGVIGIQRMPQQGSQQGQHQHQRQHQQSGQHQHQQGGQHQQDEQQGKQQLEDQAERAVGRNSLPSSQAPQQHQPAEQQGEGRRPQRQLHMAWRPAGPQQAQQQLDDSGEGAAGDIHEGAAQEALLSLPGLLISSDDSESSEGSGEQDGEGLGRGRKGNSSSHIHIHFHVDTDDSSKQGGGGGDGSSRSYRRSLHMAAAGSERQQQQHGLADTAAAGQDQGPDLHSAPSDQAPSWRATTGLWGASPSAAAGSTSHSQGAAGSYVPEDGPGVFIYYQPLGMGMSKADNPGWTHGWGTPLHSFWCCYGTAVESFSKLADSIYFKSMPSDHRNGHTRPNSHPDGLEPSPAGPSSPVGSSSSGRSGAASTGAGAEPSGADGGGGRADGWGLPVLFVNQLVSSSVRWRELRMVVRQEADLYGPENAATARLSLDIYPPDLEGPTEGPGGGAVSGDGGGADRQGEAGSGGGSGSGRQGGDGSSSAAEMRRFVLNWRIPGWAKASEVQIRINGKNYSQCAEVAAAAEGAEAAGAAAGAAASSPPRFGAGARFCSLGNTWSSGDVVEVLMPMRVVAEDLNEWRPQLRSLKAIMLGPLLMAGLTHEGRDLAADPARLEEALSVPSTDGLVSLAASPAPAAAADGAGRPHSTQQQQPLLLHHCGGVLQLGGGCRGRMGAPLDATFRLVAPLGGGGAAIEQQAAAGADVAQGAITPGAPDDRLRQLLMSPAAAAAGLHQAAADGGGGDASQQAAPLLASFESASQPGQYLTADSAGGRLLLRRPADASSLAEQTFRLIPVVQQPAGGSAAIGGAGAALGAAAQLAFRLEPMSQPGARLELGQDGQQLCIVQAQAAAGHPAGDSGIALVLAPPAAPAYPRGARLLRGGNTDYLLVPIGQVVDERYTAYFNFTGSAGGKHR